MEEKYLDIMGHSLGINIYHAKKSKLKRDKKLPKEFYRNRFCAGQTHSDIDTIKDLISKGYMESGAVINEGRDTFYHVTDWGIERFKELFNSHILS